MMTRLRALWAYLRGTFWLVPSSMALGATGLAFGMVWLDELVTGEFIDGLSWVYTGGPDGAREVLSTIAGSMITVAGVSFSITIVALTLASQQFGPRILRSFLRDMGNQVVLGTFVSTFLYCLLVLRTVRGHDGAEFVPHMAVTTGVVLATLSLGSSSTSFTTCRRRFRPRESSPMSPGISTVRSMPCFQTCPRTRRRCRCRTIRRWRVARSTAVCPRCAPGRPGTCRRSTTSGSCDWRGSGTSWLVSRRPPARSCGRKVISWSSVAPSRSTGTTRRPSEARLS